MKFPLTSIRTVFLFLLVSTLSGCWFGESKQSGDGVSNALFLINSGGSVEIRRGSESVSLFSTTVSDGSDNLNEGEWEASTEDLEGDELLVVEVIGGKDVSAEALEVSPEASVFAFATASDIEDGININPLTDMIWRVAHRYVARSHIEDSLAYLDSLASLFLNSDIDGDGEVSYSDALVFDPNSLDHLERLSFDFNVLCCNEDNYVNQVLSGTDQKTIEIALQNIFGPSISFDQSSSISRYSTVTLLGMGSGRVLDEAGESVYESDKHKDLLYISKVRDTSYFLTAYPEPGSEILKWNGCSEVSSDKTQCELSGFKADRVVEVIFGYEDTVVSGAYVDLDGKYTGSYSPGQLLVDLPADAHQRADLLGLSRDNYTAIFLNDDLRLIKVLSLTNLGSAVQIDFEEAGIFDVIEKGTALFEATYDASDVVDIEYPNQMSNSSDSSTRSYQLSTVAGDEPNEIRVVAKSVESEDPALSGGDRWSFSDGGLELDGSVSLNFSLDTVLNSSLADGTKSVMITPKLTSEGSFSVLASGSLKTPQTEDGQDVARLKVARLRFAQRWFFFSFVPVKVGSYIDIFIGANGEIQGSSGFEVEQEGSIALSLFFDSEGEWDLTPKQGFGLWLPVAPVAEGSARLRGYIELQPVVSLYGQGGPSFPTERYAEYRASLDLFSECPESFDYGIFTGNSVSFELDFNESDFFKKLGFSPRYLSTNLSSSVETKVAGGVLNSCEPFVPGTLMLAGPGIAETIESGDSTDIIRILEVRNNGGQPISWSASYSRDSYLTVQPDSGELDAGQAASVQVTFNNLGDEQVRQYENYLEFSSNSGQADAPVPYRQVEVDVVPYRLSRPEISKSARSPGVPTEARIAWSVPKDDEQHIFGFDIYQTQDPELAELDDFIKENDEWELLGSFEADERDVIVSDLNEERTFVVVQAFGNRGQIVQSEAVELDKQSASSFVLKTDGGAYNLSYDGNWNASPTEDSEFGNVDWKGFYSGGLPTRILSWHGPKLRYFGRFETSVTDEVTGRPLKDSMGEYIRKPNYDTKIYQDGKLHSIAPGLVLGSAITQVETPTGFQDWLVVIVNNDDGSGDFVYGKPNEPSPSVIGAAPETQEWKLIAEFPENLTAEVLSGGWFFNSEGTEAQAVRYELVSNEETNSQPAMVPRRFKITLNGVVSAELTQIENQIGSYQDYGIASGTPVIAVDYDSKGEKLLRQTHESILKVGEIGLFDQDYFGFECFGLEGFKRCEAGPANTFQIYDHGLLLNYWIARSGESVNAFLTIDYLDIRTSTIFISMLYETDSGEEFGEYAAWSGGELLYSRLYEGRLNGTNLYQLPNLINGGPVPNEVLGYYGPIGDFEPIYTYGTYNKWSDGSWATSPSGEVSSYERKEFGPMHFLSNGNLNSLPGVVLSGENLQIGVR